MKYLIGFIIGLIVAGGMGWAQWESFEEQVQHQYQERQWILQQQQLEHQQYLEQQQFLRHPC